MSQQRSNVKVKLTLTEKSDAKPRTKSVSDALEPPVCPGRHKFASPQPKRHTLTSYPSVSKRTSKKAIMDDIHESSKGKFDDRNVKLLGYEDSSSDDDESYSDDCSVYSDSFDSDDESILDN